MTASPIDPSGELRALASDCVHCGFCLPVCPTYQLWGEEMDSPRGRIHLMTQILDGAAASGTAAGDASASETAAGETAAGGTAAGNTLASEAAATHLDRCLGCMACVPACPSGVHYDRLIEAARGLGRGAAGRRGAGPAAAPLAARPGGARGDLRDVPVPGPAPAAHPPAAGRPAHRAHPRGSSTAR